MKNVIKAKAALYGLLLSGLIYAGFVLIAPTQGEAQRRTCCVYGEDCPVRTTTYCCMPGITEANCSQAKPDYCRTGC